MKIRKNDTVLVISGKDSGKKGKVRLAFPKGERVIIEGINMQKKTTKRVSEQQPGGIIEREAPLHIASVMFLCSKCSKPSRIGFRTLKDGRKVRVCRACGKVVD